MIMCFPPFWAQAQSMWSVKDASSLEPIAYAKVYCEVKGYGVLANASGFFSLPIHAAPSDVLNVTCVGYKPLSLTVATVMAAGGVLLTEDAIETQEVVIEASSVKPVAIGLQKSGGKIELEFSASLNERYFGSIPVLTESGDTVLVQGTLGHEAGVRVLFKRPTRVNTIHFFVRENTFEAITFRLHIYKFEQDGSRKSVLGQNILFKMDGGTGWQSWDVAQSQLLLDGEYLISFEWVDFLKEPTQTAILLIPGDKRYDNDTWVKKIDQRDWFSYLAELSIWFEGFQYSRGKAAKSP
ncbi:MAG: carboxypeptidase-like regulatory domain-containing protein [Bacteroidia bacterium]|nr:carboxypeptidase-like regulatory domain-containing protein [Bacteroidia bacterium]